MSTEVAEGSVRHLDHSGLHLARPDGSTVTVPLLALRDRCDCASCSHPSGQRLLDPAAFPTDLAATVVAVDDGFLRLHWTPEGHHSTYALAELLADPPAADDVLPWDAGAADRLAVGDHQQITADGEAGSRALLDWLRGVAAMGCGVLTGVPTLDGEVARVAELFGFVRETNYGRWFDVWAQADPTNLANTSLGLPPHTDNPYRDPVPTMQLLHCHQSSAAGGDNVLVDGFRVAAELRTLDPDGFAQLAGRAVSFAYRDAGASLTTTAPIIDLDVAGNVRGVRFNHRSLQQLPLPTNPAESEQLSVWYRGYTHFARLVADPRFHLFVHLRPGDLFIVDNRRVLHGRTAYEAGGGSRHLQGCYADVDGLRSTIAVLQHRLDAAADDR
ncbi:MAG: TauD/TfdA family dioxygenase [Actinomycetota bacterium]|nr:TauD/TfdA family dioxygenase [Actinomycetota bacterium]